MGKLLDAVTAETRSGGNACRIAQLLPDLPKDIRADLETILADPAAHSTAIARAVTGLGWELSHGSVQRHRRGDCSCGSAR